MGTTGILISKNIKFKILPSTNASLSDFTGFFALKTNQKITCVDFRGEITTKVCRNRERYHLILWYLSSAFKTTTRQKVRSWIWCFLILIFRWYPYHWDLVTSNSQSETKNSQSRFCLIITPYFKDQIVARMRL